MGVGGKTQPRRGLLTDALSAALSRKLVKDVWFNNRNVILDGYRFANCRFDNCKLTVSSCDFQLDRCIVDPSTAVIYGDDTVRVIRLFNSRNERAYTDMPAFAPTRHEDGTISIG